MIKDKFSRILSLLAAVLFFAPVHNGVCAEAAGKSANIIFLHHSTGENIWHGGVPEWFEEYNAVNGTDYRIIEQSFPKDQSYGWENYPYDYWNIQVNHAGHAPFKQESTLEILTGKYDMIVWKHCFPVCYLEEDTGNPDVASPERRLENYRLQYEALKTKMQQFPKTKFIIWTGAAQVKNSIEPAAANCNPDLERAKTSSL